MFWTIRLGSSVALLMAGTAMPGVAADEPAVPIGTRLAARTQPVVQLIRTEYTGTVTVAETKTNWTELHRAERKLWALQRRGKIPKDLQGLNRYWLNLVRGHPERYNIITARKPIRVTLSYTCSGWFATPYGHLVTAAHCVRPDVAELREAMGRQVFPPLIRRDYYQTLKSFTTNQIREDGSRGQVIAVDADMRRLMWEIAAYHYLRHTIYSRPTTKVTIALGIKGDGQRRNIKNVPAAILSAGEAYPGRDVAVLKINGYGNLPSLSLGDEKLLRVGDPLYIDGFPGTVTSSKIFNEQSKREPTFTEGPLSAFRTTAKGVAYLQTQAPAYRGNSGGPVLDSTGEVVGILIAGSADQSTGQIVAGQEFVLPAGLIAQELAKHRARATTGPVTQLYTMALDYNYAKLHALATIGFDQVSKLFPEHPYAAHYAQLNKRQTPAVTETPPTPQQNNGSFPWLPVALAVVLTALLTATGTVLLVRRTARPKTVRGAI